MAKVISGGQTGADQAGLRAAKAAGYATGGWMPKGFLTEDGPRPEFAGLYGIQEHPSPLYPPRTEANAAMATLTLWFGSGDSRGYWCTKRACEKAMTAFYEVPEGDTPDDLARRIRALRCRVLNVAGNRESSSLGIGVRVEAFLAEVLAILARDRA